ncbi:MULTISPECIES: rhamnogalacturonan acetylesterase [unclassified Streptomyces]|uniref:rhamnogalacturonan acetylesterase n=1 Tax=unclassified Streptomyces TaxID=2593676 RepID=UPI00278C5C48|nr:MULTISPECIES: rhamnogalacturonan acetylesterase [unclassified Streptomyces]
MSTTRRATLAALASLPLAAATLTSPASAATTTRDDRRRTLFIAGDSTAAQKYLDAKPESGWGTALPFFLADRVRVANHAVNGRSSKSFADEGRLDTLLAAIRPGDLLLVQFAHNDEKSADPTRYTEPWSTYQEYLKLYVDGARAKGARPVLATSVERRKFDASGNSLPTHGDYPASMRALAEEEGVALLDLQALSLALWQKLGVEGTKTYFNWTATEQDNTHFNPPGAIAVARLVATELLAREVLPARDVRRTDELDELDPAWQSRLTWLSGTTPA